MENTTIKVDSKVLEDAPRVHLSRRELIAGLAAGSVLPFVSGCTTNPYTGEQELAFFPEGQISQMAASAWTDLKKQTPQVADSSLRRRVMNIWNRVERVTPKAGEQWDVAVFDDDSANAFVMPGNRVGIYRGIVELAENDDQISSVLGHEVGHTVYRHSNRRMSQTLLAQGALIAGQIAVAQSDTLREYGTEIAALGGAAIQFGVILPYSRAHESEADRVGVDYMHSAGYRVAEAPRLWELMDERSRGKRPPEFMSTHPDPARRAADLRRYINAKGYDLV